MAGAPRLVVTGRIAPAPFEMTLSTERGQLLDVGPLLKAKDLSVGVAVSAALGGISVRTRAREHFERDHVMRMHAQVSGTVVIGPLSVFNDSLIGEFDGQVGFFSDTSSWGIAATVATVSQRPLGLTVGNGVL